MTRICGENINEKKRVVIALRAIYGIGPTKAEEVCEALKISSMMKAKELSTTQASDIQKYIENNIAHGVNLRNKVHNDIDREKMLRTHRGIRHGLNLPVRGQRTKTNSRTKRKRSTSAASSAPAAQLKRNKK